MSDVFFVPTSHDEPAAARVEALWRRAAFDVCFKPTDLTAIKVHVGEPGCKTFIGPERVLAVVRCVQATGARPFLTDTAVLYRSPRDNGVTHAEVARAHGFGHEAMGVPFIPGDGLNGSDEIEVEVGGRHFDRVTIASAIMHASSLVVVSHATGHLGTGLGGALKNLGMGCSSRKAKLRQHHGQHPTIRGEQCTACGTCAEWCPSDAITVHETAEIDAALCIGCGECIAVCRDGAVRFGWGIMGRELQERIVEHAAAVVRAKRGRMVHVTVAERITKDCDCLSKDQRPLLEDIGILASLDPVALDQAVLELVRERAGRTLESMSYPQHDAAIQLRYAEELGLGQRDFSLVRVDGA